MQPTFRTLLVFSVQFGDGTSSYANIPVEAELIDYSGVVQAQQGLTNRLGCASCVLINTIKLAASN